jgi:hypothetical protein
MESGLSSVIIIVGVLQIIAGMVVFGNAASAIHEILGSITFGLGVLSVALGTVIQQLTAIRAGLEVKKP